MRSGFYYLQLVARGFLQPFGELKREQFAKQRPHADARIEVSTPPNRDTFPLIKSIFGTIQGQIHEVRERDCPLHSYLRFNFFNQCAHLTG